MTRRAFPRLFGTTLAFAFIGAGGCKQILSIDDAKVDPSLTAGSAGSSGTAGTAGEGGTGGVGGTSGTGGSSGTAGESDSGTDADASDGNLGTPCEQYCNAAMTNCSADYAIYSDYGACLATCAAMPEGNPGDETGNTVYCRLRAANLAKSFEPDFYCPIAGPGGNGKCGSNCESLCVIYKAVCIGDNYLFANDAACLSSCAKAADLGTFSLADGARGNTVQCRLLHASNSAVEPDDHCPHAAGYPPCNSADGG